MKRIFLFFSDVNAGTSRAGSVMQKWGFYAYPKFKKSIFFFSPVVGCALHLLSIFFKRKWRETSPCTNIDRKGALLSFGSA